MRLESYEKKIAPNTGPGGGVQDVGGAQAAASMALPGGLEPLIRGIGAYKDYEISKIDKNIDLAVTEARTDYLNQMAQLLHDKDNGLLNTEYKGANGITDAFVAKEKEIREKVFKCLPNYEKAHLAMKNMADAFVTKTLPNVETHEHNEFEKDIDLQFSNYVTAQMNLAIASGTAGSMDMAFQGVKQQAMQTYKDRGSDYIQAKIQKEIDNMGTAILQAKMAAGNVDDLVATVDALKRNGVSEAVLATVREKSKTMQLSNNIGKAIKELGPKYGWNNKDGIVTAAMNAMQNRDSGASYEKMKTTMDSMVGKPYQWGGNGDGDEGIDCSGFTQKVYRSVGAEIPRTADMQLRWCEENNCLHTDKGLKDLKEGDMVFYSGTDPRFPPSDDPNCGDAYAYKGVTHVGIYIGNGKVRQAGSSRGVSDIPVDTYNIVGYGGPKRGLTQADIDKRREIAEVEYEKQYREHRQDVARRADAVKKQFGQFLADNPDASPLERKNFLENVVGNDADLKGEFGAQMAALSQQHEKQTRSGVEKVTMWHLQGMIATGEIRNKVDLANVITSKGIALNPDQIASLENDIKDRTEGKGKFAYNWDEYWRMHEFADIDSDLKEGMKAYTIAEINKYKNEYKEEPTDTQIIQWLKDSVVKHGIQTSYTWFGQRTRMVSPAAMYQQHIYKVEQVVGNDNNPYFVVHRSPREGDTITMTPAEFDELMSTLE